MRCIKTGTAALISLSLLGASAQAASSLCTTPQELAALRTAAVQQELMVAGLTCHAIDAYNRFVIAYRPELQQSDADLKAYFVRRDGARGEAEYDTFKTKLANLSSLSDIANSTGYCASTRAAFDMAMQSRQSLASFVADQRLMIALPEQQLCAADPARPMTARAEPAPTAPLRFAAVAPVAVAGVPSHDMPASPYGARMGTPGARVAPPPPAYQPPQSTDARDGDEDEDYDDDQDTAPIPPAPPRLQRPAVIQAQREQAYGAAGWPPGWGPQPYPRWYRPDPYSYYYGR